MGSWCRVEEWGGGWRLRRGADGVEGGWCEAGAGKGVSIGIGC